MAEDTGVVRAVGSQILGSALALWEQMSKVLDWASLPRVSVNVTASELADVTFADKVNVTAPVRTGQITSANVARMKVGNAPRAIRLITASPESIE